MKLVATLSRQDLESAFEKLTPLEIQFHPPEEAERTLVVHPPTSLRLVAGKGVEISTSAKVTWGLLGIAVPVSIEHIRVWLLPSLVERNGTPALAFALRLETADVAVLPAFLDARVVDAVNEALAADDAIIVWDFLKTLTFEFDLPKKMTPGRVGLHALSGNLDIGAEALVLGVTYEMKVPARKG